MQAPPGFSLRRITRRAKESRLRAKERRRGTPELDGCLVSSVYFDDDHLDVYRTRMQRLEGATLVRARWYGSDGSPSTEDRSPFTIPALSAAADDGHGPSRVYVERKTHHESWSQESSVKERFRLDARDLRSYLAAGVGAKSQTSDRTLDQTLDAESATLAKEIALDQLSARGLAPSVGTRYRRTAFQRADTNDVRVSLDVDLTFTDARDCAMRRPGAHPTRAPVRFPRAILEVKLARTDGDDDGGTPDWIEDVLATGRATEVKKFSKFLHATAAAPGGPPRRRRRGAAPLVRSRDGRRRRRRRNRNRRRDTNRRGSRVRRRRRRRSPASARRAQRQRRRALLPGPGSPGPDEPR